MEEKNQTMDKSSEKEFVITRIFNAPMDLVWSAYTEADRLKEWWGPKGFKMKVSKVDLRPGGMFFYGMEAPDGSMMWGRFIYKEIVPKTKLIYVVSFSDEKGGITRHPIASDWPAEILCTMTLNETNGKTTMILKGAAHNATPEECEIFFGGYDSMEQGFGGTYDQLDEYLAKQ